MLVCFLLPISGSPARPKILGRLFVSSQRVPFHFVGCHAQGYPKKATVTVKGGMFVSAAYYYSVESDNCASLLIIREGIAPRATKVKKRGALLVPPTLISLDFALE